MKKSNQKQQLRVDWKFIEFLHNNRQDTVCGTICKMLVHIENDRCPAANLFFTTDEINFLSFRDDGTISYLPAGKECVKNKNGDWARDNRQSAKPSKVIKKILSKSGLKFFNDAHFESFANKYKAEGERLKKKFVLRPASEIVYVYCDMIRHESGRLDDSCMNGDHEFLKFYTKQKCLQILTLQDKDDMLCGRALVWEISEGVYFMDRVYTSQDELDELFIEYAAKNKWWRKDRYTTYSYKDRWINPTSGLDEIIHVRVPVDSNGLYFPYIDTFSYGGVDYLTNKYDEGANRYQYTETNGNRQDKEQVWDKLNDEYIYRANARYITRGIYRGAYIPEDESIQVDGYWYWIEDSHLITIDGIIYSTYDSYLFLYEGVYYLRTDERFAYVEYHSDYFKREDCVLIEDRYGEQWQLKREVVTIGDKLYHRYSNEIVSIGGVWYEITNPRIIETRYGYTLLETNEAAS